MIFSLLDRRLTYVIKRITNNNNITFRYRAQAALWRHASDYKRLKCIKKKKSWPAKTQYRVHHLLIIFEQKSFKMESNWFQNLIAPAFYSEFVRDGQCILINNNKKTANKEQVNHKNLILVKSAVYLKDHSYNFSY